jgi:hypothetical protein
MLRPSAPSSYGAQQEQNLQRQVHDRVSGLLAVRDGAPYLPTAQALVAVAAQLVATFSRKHRGEALAQYDRLAQALVMELRDHLAKQRAMLPDDQTTSTTARTPATVS